MSFYLIFYGLLVLIISGRLFFKLSGGFYPVKLNLISVIFYKDFLLLTFFGVMAVSLSLDKIFNIRFFGVSGHVSDDVRIYGWIYFMYALISFPMGIYFIKKLFFRGSLWRESNQLGHQKFLNYKYYLNYENEIILTLFIFLCISALSVVYVFFSIGEVPLLQIFKGASPEKLAVLRADSKLHFSGIKIIKDVFAINLPIFLSYASYFLKKVSRNGIFKLLFYFSFAICFFSLSYNLEKVPIFYYLFGILLINFYFRRHVPIFKFFIFSACVLFGLSILYYLTKGLGPFEIISEMGVRIFVAESSSIFLSLEYFPDIENFLGHKGISGVLASLAGEERVNYGRLIFEVYNPDAVERGVAGFIVGLFIAEAWALFGFPGAVVAPFLLGCFIQLLIIVLNRLPGGALPISFYTFFIIKLGLTGGMSHIIFPTVFGGVVLCYIIFNLTLCTLCLTRYYYEKRLMEFS